MSSKGGSRRPIRVRNASLAKKIARWLCHKSITPNQISIASVGFACLAALCLYLLPAAGGAFRWILPLFAALFIQGRLLCNLFDGMVAVEGGKSTKSGELFNDIPDRIADPIILIATGYAVRSMGWGITIGWIAGLLAVMTAYIRTLCASLGAPMDFQGPMAKQHRMAVITTACVLTIFWQTEYVLFTALLVIALGSFLTCCKRVSAAYTYLER